MRDFTKEQSSEFEAAVLDSFKFLEKEYGFLRRSSQPKKFTQLVVYESSELYVILSHAPPSYEPEMSFGRRGIDDVYGAYSFHPGDLIQLDCCRDWVWKKDNRSTLVNWVAELARLLSDCGAQCLSGNYEIFVQMKDRRDSLIADWQRDEMLHGLRSKIDSAWKKKDYEEVLRLYKYIDDLSDLDKKRIAFSDAHRKEC